MVFCDLCHQTADGVFLDPDYIALGFRPSHLRDVEFPSGKYAGRTFSLDVRNPQTCYQCLEKLVEQGFDICHQCRIAFSDSWDQGASLSEDGRLLSWYGSRHDQEHHHYLNLIPSQWYCYSCLDREVDENRTQCLRITPGHIERSGCQHQEIP